MCILPDCIFSTILQSRILEVTVGPRSFGSMLWGKTGLQAIHPAVSRQPFAGETPGLMVVEPPFVLAHMRYDPFSAAILTDHAAPQRELARRLARRVGRAPVC
jgi:hypothetical protein